MGFLNPQEQNLSYYVESFPTHDVVTHNSGVVSRKRGGHLPSPLH